MQKFEAVVAVWGADDSAIGMLPPLPAHLVHMALHPVIQYEGDQQLLHV